MSREKGGSGETVRVPRSRKGACRSSVLFCPPLGAAVQRPSRARPASRCTSRASSQLRAAVLQVARPRSASTSEPLTSRLEVKYDSTCGGTPRDKAEMGHRVGAGTMYTNPAENERDRGRESEREGGREGGGGGLRGGCGRDERGGGSRSRASKKEAAAVVGAGAYLKGGGRAPPWPQLPCRRAELDPAPQSVGSHREGVLGCGGAPHEDRARGEDQRQPGGR